MDKYIGFGIHAKKTVDCALQKGQKDSCVARADVFAKASAHRINN